MVAFQVIRISKQCRAVFPSLTGFKLHPCLTPISDLEKVIPFCNLLFHILIYYFIAIHPFFISLKKTLPSNATVRFPEIHKTRKSWLLLTLKALINIC